MIKGRFKYKTSFSGISWFYDGFTGNTALYELFQKITCALDIGGRFDISDHHLHLAGLGKYPDFRIDVRYKLTLLPMYLSSFGYKNKTYRVLVNGQSGKCSGQSPVSALRVMIAVLLGLAVAFGLYWLFTGGGSASSGTTTFMYY